MSLKRTWPWLGAAALLAAGLFLWWRFGDAVWLEQAIAWCT